MSDTESSGQSDWLQKNMKSKAFQITQSILFLGVGLFLMYWAFRDKDIKAIYTSIQQANYYYAIPIFIASMTGLVLRSYRWQMLMRPFAPNIPLAPYYHSLMFGYFINYALPRIGELVRCYTLERNTKASAAKAFGTVMVERLVDLFCLLLLMGIILLTQYDLFGGFFNTHIWQPFVMFYQANKVLVWGLAFVIIVLLIWLGKEGEKSEGTDNKLDRLINDVYAGLTKTHRHLPWFRFSVVTLAIWVCYFFTSYLWLLAIADTVHIGVMQAWVIMAVGSLAKSLPIQGGGMGAYHLLVAGLLGMWGISEAASNAYAILNHGIQMVIQIVFGGLSGLFLLRISNKNSNRSKSPASESANPVPYS